MVSYGACLNIDMHFSPTSQGSSSLAVEVIVGPVVAVVVLLLIIVAMGIVIVWLVLRSSRMKSSTTRKEPEVFHEPQQQDIE